MKNKKEPILSEKPQPNEVAKLYASDKIVIKDKTTGKILVSKRG